MPLPETLPMASAGTRRSGNRAGRMGPATAESVNMSSYRSSSFGGSTSSSSAAAAAAAAVGEEKNMDPMSTFSRFWFDDDGDDGDGGTTVQSVSIVSTLERTRANHERQPPQNDDDDDESLTVGDATETSVTVLSGIVEPREVQNRQQQLRRGKILNHLSCAPEMESLDVVSIKDKPTSSKSSPYKRQSPLIRLLKGKNNNSKNIDEGNAGRRTNENQSRRVDQKKSNFREAKVALVKRRSDKGQHVDNTEKRDDSIVDVSDHGDSVRSEAKGRDKSKEIIHDEVAGDGEVANNWFPAFWAWNFNSTSAQPTNSKKDETSETNNQRQIDWNLESSKSPTMTTGGTIPSTLPKPKSKMLERPQDNSRQERQRQRIVALLESKEEESQQQQQQQSKIALTGNNLSTSKKSQKTRDSTKSILKQPEILHPKRGVPIDKQHDQPKDHCGTHRSETEEPDLTLHSLSSWLGGKLGGAPTNVIMATDNNQNAQLSQNTTTLENREYHQPDDTAVPQSLTEVNGFKPWGRSGSRGNVGKKDLRGMVSSIKAQRLMDQMMQRQNSSSEGLFVSQQDLRSGGGGASQHRRLKQSMSEEKRMLRAVSDAVRRRMQDIEKLEKTSEDEGSITKQGKSSNFGCGMFSS